MAAIIRKLTIFITLYLITKLPICIHGKQQVPCVFFFGDSASDNGNNNFLFTKAKVNYPPYGIDYPAGPTGRFCNGKNIPDFLAESLGFDKPAPPFATAIGAQILQGVNYASGGAGILDDSGRAVGGRISMNGQLINHGITALKIAALLGNTTLATDHLNKCLYVVNIGINDYVNNYFLPQYFLTSSFYTPQRFAATLIKHYDRQLRRLYKYGARKVVVFGLVLPGSAPQFLSNNQTNGSSSSMNNTTQLFNKRLKPLIDALNAHLHHAQFILINSTNIQLQPDPFTTGFKVKNAPCCVASKSTGLCVRGSKPCSNRNDYYFWDAYHVTEIANRGLAARAYASLLPADAYPTNIRNLVQQ